MEKQNSKFILVLSTIFGLVAGALAGGSTAVWLDLKAPDSEESIIYSDEISFEETWQSASEAIVSIVATKELQQYYNQFTPTGQRIQVPTGQTQIAQVSSGTGFIIESEGLGVTNRHVVEDEEADYVAILVDGTELDVEVLGRDSLNDIALIQVSTDGVGALPALEFADSDEIQVGQPVLAVGNALGEYAHTASSGIISATGRSILASSSYGQLDSLIDLIQTDAAINSGNSGGPLLNLAGEVLGMNTAVDSQAEGIGFAIPSNDILQVVDSYRTYGEIRRPSLGVRTLQMNANLSRRFRVPYDYGLLLIGDQGSPAVNPGSAAERAGLQEGDLILEVNGEVLGVNYTLNNALLGYDFGDLIVLTVWRSGQELLGLELEL